MEIHSKDIYAVRLGLTYQLRSHHVLIMKDLLSLGSQIGIFKKYDTTSVDVIIQCRALELQRESSRDESKDITISIKLLFLAHVVIVMENHSKQRIC